MVSFFQSVDGWDYQSAMLLGTNALEGDLSGDLLSSHRSCSVPHRCILQTSCGPLFWKRNMQEGALWNKLQPQLLQLIVGLQVALTLSLSVLNPPHPPIPPVGVLVTARWDNPNFHFQRGLSLW